jgi:hypothetical protein
LPLLPIGSYKKKDYIYHKIFAKEKMIKASYLPKRNKESDFKVLQHNLLH